MLLISQSLLHCIVADFFVNIISNKLFIEHCSLSYCLSPFYKTNKLLEGMSYSDFIMGKGILGTLPQNLPKNTPTL